MTDSRCGWPRLPGSSRARAHGPSGAVAVSCVLLQFVLACNSPPPLASPPTAVAPTLLTDSPPVSPTVISLTVESGQSRPTARTLAPTPTAAIPRSTPFVVAPVASVRPTQAGGPVRVDAGDDFFSPSQLTVTVGTTVLWTNVGGVEHNIDAEDGSFGSASLTLGPADRYRYTFTAAGHFPYKCEVHQSMVGEIDVD